MLAAICITMAGAHAGFAQTSASGLPSGWSSADVGNPAVAGNVQVSGGTITVNGAGSGIWETSDEFHFVYTLISGDVDLQVRLDSVSQVQDWTSAGIMVRESLNRGARNAFLLASAKNGLAFQSRALPNSQTSRKVVGSGTLPAWLRLVRKGRAFTAYASTDGASWIEIGAATINMRTAVLVGLAVTSSDYSRIASASFSNLRLGDPLAAPSLDPWTAVDVGSPTVAGTATLASGTFTLTGAGTGLANASDQFHFVYQAFTGDIDMVARVASLVHVNSASNAGVMIRETLDPSSAHASMVATGGEGWLFRHRPWSGSASADTSAGSGLAPGYVRLVRIGDVITAYRSTDGQHWNLVGSVTIPMAATVHVGLIVASHEPALAATGVFDNVGLASPLLEEPAEPDSGGDESPPPAEGPLPVATTTLVFEPSPDHATGVDSYTLEIRREGDALTVAPVATQNLGKPAIVSGEISVDISATVDALQAGSYYAAVYASGPGGTSTRAVSGSFSK